MAWEDRLHHAGAQALYLHVPFCVRKCAYCDFSSWTTRRDDPLMADYRLALEAQVEEAARLGLLGECATCYVGGGTPTMLGAGLADLVSRVRSLADVVELTCEANPDSLSDEVLAAVVAAGATRLSIGVQSLDDAELAALGRMHTGAEAVERLEAAVSTGLAVSADLMCAIPLQTPGSWARTLEGVVATGVGHVSVYPLMIEEGTPLASRFEDDDCPWNDSDVEAARMCEAQSLLEGSGFARYEVASYACAGRQCRHNIAYWTGRPYLGLGCGASSMLSLEGYLRLVEGCPQLPEAPADASRARLTVTTSRERIARDPALAALGFEVEFLDARQAAAEDLMLAARMSVGIPQALLAHAEAVIGVETVRLGIESLVSGGYLTSGLAPTPTGWLLGNELYGRLWGLAGEGKTQVATC